MFLEETDLLEDAARAELSHTKRKRPNRAWTLCVHGAKVLCSDLSKDVFTETLVVEFEAMTASSSAMGSARCS